MQLDNTIFSIYSKCPKMYFERYEADNSALQTAIPMGKTGESSNDGNGPSSLLPILHAATSSGGIELDQPAEGRDFGTRMHQLLHERRLVRLGLRATGPPSPSPDNTSESGQVREAIGHGQTFTPAPEWPDEAIESEAQATLAAYEAHYVRDFEYLESERTSRVPCLRGCPECGGEGSPKISLPDDQRICKSCGHQFTIHELVVKLDAVVRFGDKTIGPMDTKSEGRPGYNTREDWSGRTQAKAYLYALERLYPHEKVSRLVVDVVTRASPKARRGPLFTRLDDIRSTPEAIEEAIQNISLVGDDIEHARRVGFWRSNMNLCKRGWERCDYFLLHVEGRTEANLRKYRPAEQYLDL